MLPWPLSKEHYQKLQQVTKNENTKSEPQNNHIKDTRVIIMSATLERPLLAYFFKHYFKTTLIVSPSTLSKLSTSNGSITSNGSHKSEPQNNHIKETLIIIMSTTSERSLWPSVFKHSFKIAPIVFPWTLNKGYYKKTEQVIVRILLL